MTKPAAIKQILEIRRKRPQYPCTFMQLYRQITGLLPPLRKSIQQQSDRNPQHFHATKADA
jgi:hypothetical protein